MKSLQSSADSLLVSANRLATEVHKETKYWQDVLNLKQEGWALCRKPNELHTLAIRYGFEEARSSNTRRGLALLRREEGGNVSLDFGGDGTEQRLLQVKIIRGGRADGASGNPTMQALRADSFSDEVMVARKSLFDAEIYSELHREARTLMAWGVKALDDMIQVPMTPTSTIQLSLATPGGLSPESRTLGGESTTLQAEAVATSFRILLDHAHEQSLRRRSEPPGPVTENPPPKPLYLLIRPVLEYFSHTNASSSLKSFVVGVSSMLSATKLITSISISDPFLLPSLREVETGSSSDIFASSLDPTSSTARPTSLNETLVSTFLQPRRSNFRLHLPSTSSRPPTLSIDVFTWINAPHHHGTSFRVTLSHPPSPSALSDVPPERTFPDLEALKQHVFHLLRIAVTEIIFSEIPKGWSVSRPHLGRVDVKKTGPASGGKFKVIFADLDNSTSMTLRWRVDQGGGQEEQSKTWYGTLATDGAEQQGVLDISKDIFTRKMRL